MLYNSIITMQGYHTNNTEDTGSLDYNSVCYITSRIEWVSLKGIYRYRCRRDPGNCTITIIIIHI